MKPGVSLAVYCVALALSLVAYQNCADVTFSSLQLSSESGLGLDCIDESQLKLMLLPRG